MADVTKIEEVLRELKRCNDCGLLFHGTRAEQCSCGGNLCWLIESAKLDAEQPEQRRCVNNGVYTSDGKFKRCWHCWQTWGLFSEPPICKGAPAEPPKFRMMACKVNCLHYLGFLCEHTREHPEQSSCDSHGCQPVPDAAPIKR